MVSGKESTVRRPRLAVTYHDELLSPMDLTDSAAGEWDLVWVTDLARQQRRTARLLPRLGSIVDTGELGGDAVTRAVAEEAVDGVVAFTDDQVLLAARLTTALGLVGHSHATAAALTNKLWQRRVLAAAGVEVPPFVEIPTGATVAESLVLVEPVRFPAVLKPQHGAASRDTFYLDGLPALRAVLSKLLDQEGDGLREGFVLEGYLRDEVELPSLGFASYVSVESLSRDGVFLPIAVTGNFPLAEAFRESGGFLPSALSAERTAAVVNLADRAAQALGVAHGALHTEIKLTPDGPRVLEVNGRVGGGAVAPLARKRTGVALVAAAMRVALGQHLPSPGAATHAGIDYHYRRQPPLLAGRLAGLSGLEEVRRLPSVEAVYPNRSPGDSSPATSTITSHLFSVAGVADGLEQLAGVPARVADLVTEHYEAADPVSADGPG